MRKLPLDFTYFVVRFIDELSLFRWNNEVVNTDRGTRDSRIAKAHVHQLVSEDNGFLQTNITVGGVQQTRDCLFLHGLIDHREWQPLGHDFPQQYTTNGGLGTESTRLQFTFFVLQPLGDTHLYLGMQISSTCAIGSQGFTDILEPHTFTLGVDTLTGDVVKT